MTSSDVPKLLRPPKTRGQRVSSRLLLRSMVLVSDSSVAEAFTVTSEVPKGFSA